MNADIHAFTVSQVNQYVKMILDGNRTLSDLWVTGEISNFTDHYKSGHLYFSLKDQDGLLRSVMFRSHASTLRFKPTDGMRVLVHGNVSLYPRDGQYQLYVDRMEPDGVGALYIAFEQRKQKLAAMGLFDTARKKNLPRFPKEIGVITSPTGAAIRDILEITGRRYPICNILLFPALVQGTDAPASLRSGLLYFNRHHPVDLIIIGRGGGSFEDLFAFNDEELAMTIAASAIPVISAVGHETDITICDLVADLRAPTPSAAAEMAVPEIRQLRQFLRNADNDMQLELQKKINEKRKRLRSWSETGILSSPMRLLQLRRMETMRAEERLDFATCRLYEQKCSALRTLCGKMDALNPLRVLARGYSVTEINGGGVLTDVSNVAVGTDLHIRLQKGSICATVTKINETEDYSRADKKE